VIGRLSPRLGEASLVRSTLIGVMAVTLPGLLGRLFLLVGVGFFPASLLGGTLRVVGGVLEGLTLVAGMGALLHAKAGQVEPIRMPWAGASSAPPSPPGPPPAPPAPPAPPSGSPVAPPPPAIPGTTETTLE